MDLPIICTLSESELSERRRTVLDAVRNMKVDVTPLAEGYSYAFAPTANLLMQLVHLVDLERQCCRFLTFKIVVEPGNGPIRLEITGPAGAKSVISDYFGGT